MQSRLGKQRRSVVQRLERRLRLWTDPYEFDRVDNGSFTPPRSKAASTGGCTPSQPPALIVVGRGNLLMGKAAGTVSRRLQNASKNWVD